MSSYGTGVDRAMDASLRDIRSRKTSVQGHHDPLAVVAELKGELLSLNDHREAVTRIGVPGQRLTRLEDVPTNGDVVSPLISSARMLLPPSIDPPDYRRRSITLAPHGQ
jgi:hypothetical protein